MVKSSMKAIIDTRLVQRCEMLSNGQTVHEINGLLHLYQCYAHLTNKGDDKMMLSFNRAEQNLREWVVKQVQSGIYGHLKSCG